MMEIGIPGQEMWTLNPTPRLNIKPKLVRRNRDGHYTRESQQVSGTKQIMWRDEKENQVQIDFVNLEPSLQIW